MANEKPFDPFEDLKKLAGRMEQDFFELVTGSLHLPGRHGRKMEAASGYIRA